MDMYCGGWASVVNIIPWRLLHVLYVSVQSYNGVIDGASLELENVQCTAVLQVLVTVFKKWMCKSLANQLPDLQLVVRLSTNRVKNR